MSTNKRGQEFENIVKLKFQNIYKYVFQSDELPEKYVLKYKIKTDKYNNIPKDIGIDIYIIEHDMITILIQCKNYINGYISKNDIDKFKRNFNMFPKTKKILMIGDNTKISTQQIEYCKKYNIEIMRLDDIIKLSKSKSMIQFIKNSSFKIDNYNCYIDDDGNLIMSKDESLKYVNRINQPNQTNTKKSNQSCKPIQLNQSCQIINKFRPVQDEIFNKITSDLNKNWIISAACGTGKTFTFKRIINYILKQKQNQFDYVFILVPSICLADQTYYVLTSDNQHPELKPIRLSRFYTGHNNENHNNSNVVLCVYDSVKIAFTTLSINKNQKILFIIDEAHHILNNEQNEYEITKNYDSSHIQYIKQLIKNHTYYAFSATVNNSDYIYSMGQAIEDNLLMKYTLSFYVVNENIDTKFDKRVATLLKILDENKFNHTLIYLNSNSKQVLTLNDTLNGKNKNINHNGICYYSNYILYNTSNKKRLQIFEDFKNDKIKYLISIDCISEGIDLPYVENVIFFDDPGTSEIRTIQRIGRVLRLSPNKQFGNIISFINSNIINYSQNELIKTLMKYDNYYTKHLHNNINKVIEYNENGEKEVKILNCNNVYIDENEIINIFSYEDIKQLLQDFYEAKNRIPIENNDKFNGYPIMSIFQNVLQSNPKLIKSIFKLSDENLNLLIEYTVNKPKLKLYIDEQLFKKMFKNHDEVIINRVKYTKTDIKITTKPNITDLPITKKSETQKSYLKQFLQEPQPKYYNEYYVIDYPKGEFQLRKFKYYLINVNDLFELIS